VVVRHDEPATWSALLRRRFRYGTSAAPLSLSHPAKAAPLVVQPVATATVAAAAFGSPVIATIGGIATLRATRRGLANADIQGLGATRTSGRLLGATAVGLGRYATQFATPALVASLLGGSRRRRLGAAALLVVPAVHRWSRQRPAIDPMTFTAAAIADDVAYGAGVWSGAIRHRTIAPLRPAIHPTKER
jgi:hypothetical protein